MNGSLFYTPVKKISVKVKEYVPYAYQTKAYKHILRNVFAGLFLEMGLGKTVSTLTAIVDLVLMGDVKKILIVAPLRVANNVWKQEAEKWVHTSFLTFSICTGTEKKR